MKKKFMGIALVLASALFMGNVYAETMQLKNIEIQNNSDSYKGATTKIEGNGTSNVTVTYDAAKFVLVKPKPEVGRLDKAAWFGLKIVAPSGLEETIKNATYDHGEGTEKASFWRSKDSTGEDTTSSESHFMYVYGAITEEYLTAATEKGTAITYTWRFDWDNNETIDQVVTVKVTPEKVELKDNDEDATVLWNEEKHDEVVAETELKEEHAEVAKVVATEEGAAVTVEGTILSKEADDYKEMLEKVTGKGFKTVLGAYELSVAVGDPSNGIPLVFTVGTENDGKAAYILHKKSDGTFEEFTEVVKDGKVKITVSSLSPFMIALGDVVKDDEPETNDTFPMALVGMISLGLAGTYVIKKAREN